MRFQSFREGVFLALEQLRVNRFRSALTILGLVVGVVTVMIMSAMLSGVRSSILEAFEAIGPRNFAVVRFDPDAVSTAEEAVTWRDNPKISVAEGRRMAELDAIKETIIEVSGGSATFDVGRTHVEDVFLLGESVGWGDYTAGDFVAGHDFLPSDIRGSRPVVILEAPLAGKLFGTLDPLGRRVRIDGVAFTVIGIYELDDNIFTKLVSDMAFVPFTSALKHLDVWDGFLRVLAVTADDVTQDEAVQSVIGTLRSMRGLRPGERNNFAITRQEDLLAEFNQITAIFFIIMLALSSVGLLVGGVGVIAIMMISVTERTREIGIRKALGARRREILWQFLVEAVTLTVLGGALGMLVGGGLSWGVQAVTPIPARVPLWAIVAALVMAVIAGVLFGLWPAWRAARLDPVEALRYE